MKTMRERPPISAGTPATVITRPPSVFSLAIVPSSSRTRTDSVVAPGSWNLGNTGLRSMSLYSISSTAIGEPGIFSHV